MAGIKELRDDLRDKWLRARDLTIAQVEGLSEDQLGWRPGEGARTGLQIARHIADSSVSLLDYAIRSRKPDFSEGEGDPGSREDVLRALRHGRAGIEEDLRSLSEDQLVENIPGLFGDVSPRLGFLNFAYAHEMYHYGQIGLCARASGEVPALTRFIQQQVAASGG